MLELLAVSATALRAEMLAEVLPLHGIGGRGDLPVPLWLAIYSAGAAVAVSFFALAAFWSRARFERASGRPLIVFTRIVDNRLVRLVLKAGGVLAFAVLLGAAWFGSDSPAENPAPTWLYVWIWVGILPISLLCGPIWRIANPLRTIADVLRHVTPDRPARVAGNLPGKGSFPAGGRAGSDRRLQPDEAVEGGTRAGGSGSRGCWGLPEGVGCWPAVVGLGGFVWLELVYPEGSEPVVVATFVTIYAVVNVVAGVVFGPAWFGVGDSFEVYGEVLGRLSPLGRGADGRLQLRNPLAGLATTPQQPGLVGLLCLLLGSTAFDGISRWSVWTELTGGLDRTRHIVVYTAGLIVAVGLVSVLFLLAARLSTWSRRVVQVRPGALGNAGLPGAFVHSLVPIAIGYAVAHYFSFAMFQGQAGVLLATDPFDRGWDLLGTSGARIDYTFLSTGFIAGVQIGAIVLGHVLGVVSAHDRAAHLFRRRQLRRAQYPMLAAMVAFTAGGIALVTAS